MDQIILELELKTFNTSTAGPVPSPRGGFWGLSPPKQSSKSPQTETWNTINQLRFFQFLECQATCTNPKPPYWKLSGDGSAPVHGIFVALSDASGQGVVLKGP